MTTLTWILGVTFVLCVGITPIVRRAAIGLDLVDKPDGKRKLHRGKVPVAGGLAVFMSVSAVLAGARVLPNALIVELTEQSRFLVGLLIASVIICLVGLADDRWGLRGRHKLIGQAIAVAVVIGMGLMVRTIRLFHWDIELGLLAIPFTAFWLFGAINSLNLIDGMDGLLCSVGAVISLAMGAMAIMGGQWAAACVAVALAGALLGFLCYNFPPACVFLGDSGSMLIGLVIGVLGIHSSLKGPATIALAAPVALLTIPIFDTVAAIIRRKSNGLSVYTSDSDHLHHCLLRRGFSNRVVLSFVSFACLATGAGALASLAFNNEFFAMLSALAVVGTFIATRMFGYVEFRMMKDRFVASSVALLGRTSSEARDSAIRLPDPSNWQSIWTAVTESAERQQLTAVYMDIDSSAPDGAYHARWGRPQANESECGFWRAEVPLTAGGRIVGRLAIIGQSSAGSVWSIMASIAHGLETLAVTSRAATGVQTPPLVTEPAGGETALDGSLTDAEPAAAPS